MRRRIGILVAQIEEKTQKNLLTEFIKKAYAHDIDVCIFSMYLKYQKTDLRNVGDSNIYELVNYELFDALLVMIDTILTPELAPALQETIREKFRGPVLVVDQQSQCFESVMIDHYTPFKKIVDHLIEEHGYQEIAFLGGKKGHPHSVQRLNAFLDSMHEHRLLVREEWMDHGDYWYDSGEQFARKLLADREHMPQAIVCANDYMALGAAVTLTENGIEIPRDIALTGYDAVEDGRYSPSPITSVPVPDSACGRYCFDWLYAKMTGAPKPEFSHEPELFIGASCGCEYEIEMVPKRLRMQWQTEQTSGGIYSEFNHMIEDIFSQKDIKGFLRQVRDYSYQIRPFHQFCLCLNDTFMQPERNIGDKARRKGYSDTIYQVLDIGEDDACRIALNRSFSVRELLPEMYDEREYPTTYIFHPLFFDDRCFGYSVINFGREPMLYDETFRVWMRNVMQGMEAFYRQRFLQQLVEQVRAAQVRDSLTGLYNYQGFLKMAKTLLQRRTESGEELTVIAIDVKGIKNINEVYGRESGNRAIRAVARFIQEAVAEDELSCRLCNDEFLIAYVQKDADARKEQLYEALQKHLAAYRLIADSDYVFGIDFVALSGKPEDLTGLEALVNQAVSVKNHKKGMHLSEGALAETADTLDEIKRNQLVAHILNNNLLTYYFQPIVRVSDGSIFAYEALMRYEQEEITPVQILQAAAYLDRLYDIEKATLFNVTDHVEKNRKLFGDAKVFINSLPRYQLVNEDETLFYEKLKHAAGRFVIEFTEESELNDEKLIELTRRYARIGGETALDDFGTGYSNVNNLLRYMPKYIKIDHSLITEIQNHPQKQHFVRSIIDFAHENEIQVLAEGVETGGELECCVRLGADLIQGYYTGRPQKLPAGELDSKVRKELRQIVKKLDDWQYVGL